MTPTVEYVINQVKAGTFTAQDLKDFSMVAKGGATLAPFHGPESKIPADLVERSRRRNSRSKTASSAWISTRPSLSPSN